jgi:hypothetical protein
VALSDNEFEFSGPKAREKAIAFAKQQGTRPTIRSVWVDKNTGKRTAIENGKEVKMTSKDPNAEQRFRVTVMNEMSSSPRTRSPPCAAPKSSRSSGSRRRVSPTSGSYLTSCRLT